MKLMFTLFLVLGLALAPIGLAAQTAQRANQATTVQSMLPEGKIIQLEANKVTLLRDNGQRVTVPVTGTAGFKVGDRVRIQQGRMVKMGPPSQDSRAFTPIQLPNTVEGAKPPGTGHGPNPGDTHALTPIQIPRIHEGDTEAGRKGPGPNPGDTNALTPIQIPRIHEGGTEAGRKGPGPTPGDTNALTPIQIPRTWEGGPEPGGKVPPPPPPPEAQTEQQR